MTSAIDGLATEVTHVGAGVDSLLNLERIAKALGLCTWELLHEAEKDDGGSSSLNRIAGTPMPLPTVCRMPDLSDLHSLFGPTLVHGMLGDPGMSPTGRLHRREFVRLLSKAVREYQRARDAIIAQIEEKGRPLSDMERTGRFLYMFDFTNHLETCINAVHRCLRNLDQLISEIPIDRTDRRALEAVRDDLAGVRHTVEHMDERVQKGELQAGEPLMIALADTEDRAWVGSYEIRFEDLERTLRRLHRIGVGMFSTQVRTQVAE